MKCPNCGKENREGANFCNYCGERITKEKPADASQEAKLKQDETAEQQKETPEVVQDLVAQEKEEPVSPSEEKSDEEVKAEVLAPLAKNTVLKIVDSLKWGLKSDKELKKLIKTSSLPKDKKDLLLELLEKEGLEYFNKKFSELLIEEVKRIKWDLKSDKELKKIIKTSFLPKDKKDLLLELLEKEGLTEYFNKKFNELLIEEVKRRSEEYQAVVQSFDREVAQLEKQIEKERQRLEKKLQEQLSKIEVADIKSKSKVWDEYYAEIAKLQKKQKEGIKSISRMAKKKARAKIRRLKK